MDLHLCQVKVWHKMESRYLVVKVHGVGVTPSSYSREKACFLHIGRKIFIHRKIPLLLSRKNMGVGENNVAFTPSPYSRGRGHLYVYPLKIFIHRLYIM